MRCCHYQAFQSLLPVLFYKTLPPSCVFCFSIKKYDVSPFVSSALTKVFCCQSWFVGPFVSVALCRFPCVLISIFCLPCERLIAPVCLLLHLCHLCLTPCFSQCVSAALDSLSLLISLFHPVWSRLVRFASRLLDFPPMFCPCGCIELLSTAFRLLLGF